MVRELSVELEAVTPLFLGGADPSQPEVRAASFRGALRFWWRALAAEPDLVRLKEREAAIFGDTERASSVLVDVEPLETRRVIGWEQALNHGARLDFPTRQGLNYLGFPFTQRGGARSCFPPGTRLRLSLRLRSHVQDDMLLRQAIAALWLLLNLGGLGTRSRRGLGGLRVMDGWQTESLPPAQPRTATPSALAEHLQEGLRQLRTLMPFGALPAGDDEFPIIAPNHAGILVLNQTWPSWQAALGTVGRHLAEFRKPLFPRLSDLQKGGQIAKDPERAAFGLPIQYYDPRTQMSSTLKPGTSALGITPDRRASPLLIRIAPLAEGKYTVVLTIFGGFGTRFLPAEIATLRANGATIQGKVSVQPLVRFITQLSNPKTGTGLFQVQIP